MADVQAEIARVCRLLESDKTTERKQNVTKLKSLLMQREIVQLLDVNSDEKGKLNVVCWDYILKSVEGYVKKETEYLIAQKSKSQTMASNRQKKKQEVISLLKLVIKTADGRDRCRLNGKDLTQHITSVLIDQEMNGMFLSDYQNILLKYVLRSKVYKSEITSRIWHDLIDIFAKMITSSVGERSCCVKTFFDVVTAAINQVDIKSSRLFEFFTQIFADIRNEKNPDYLLGSLNSFCSSVAIDCRGQLCQLGEDLIPSLLQIWHTSGPQPTIKDRLVQFMRLQVGVHHPAGVHSENDGAWSANTTHWKKCLQKIYEAISGEIQQITGRIRGSSVKLDSGLKGPFIELAAVVCHQLFWLHLSSSLMPLDSSTFEGPSTTKRRRVEVGWNVLRDIFTNSQETSALLGWLQITAKLFQMFPKCLPVDQYAPLLTQLHQLQVDCKRPEIVVGVMNCLRYVSQCDISLPNESVEELSPSSTWKSIWLATLRAISSHGLEDASFELLQSIVKKRLVEPGSEPWKRLTVAGCNSSDRSLRFLWCYLNTFPLPEHFYYTTQVFATPPPHVYPLRHQLFDWLLPAANKIEQQGSHASSYYSKILTRLSISLLSQVLVTLTQRICQTKNVFGEGFRFECDVTEQSESKLDTLETLYIVTSFDKKAVTEFINNVDVSNSSSTVAMENNAVMVLVDYLLQRMIEVSKKLLEVPEQVEPNSSISSPQMHLLDRGHEVQTRYCSLATKIMGILLHFKTFSFQELTSLSLFQITKSMLQTITRGLTESLAQKDEFRKPVIAALGDLFLCPSIFDHNNECVQSIMDIVRLITPKQLIDCLLQFITNEPRQTNRPMAVDEFDGSFVDSDVVMDDFETDDRIPTPGYEHKDKDVLSDQDQLRLRCMEILCTWCRFSDPSSLDEGPFDIVQGRILDYFEEMDFDDANSTDIMLFSSAAFILGSCPTKAKYLVKVLKVLRRSISMFRKDQKYCREGLRLMTVLAKQFSGRNEDGKDLKEAWELALLLLKAFWNLRETNYQSSVRLQLAKCMDAFIRSDPEKKWAFFEIKSKNEGTSCVHISHLFPDLLCDQSHQVRMYMAEAVGILFVKFNSANTGIPESPVIQDELFDVVAAALAKSLHVQKQLKGGESVDEGVNRAASLLASFKNIITVSCWCEPKVVCLLFQATKEQELVQEMVAKVLHQISSTLGYKSTHQFIKGHIGRIIDSWLNHGLELKDFPYKALEFKSLGDLLRSYHSSTMPHLIWRFKDNSSLQTIGREIGNNGDWTEFLVTDFCQIMSVIVPCFAEQSRQKTTKLENDKQRAHECHGFVEKVLTKEVSDKLMDKKFDKIVLALLLRIHDKPSELSDVSQFLREYDPPIDMPYFTSHAIKATLDYLTKCYGGSNTLVSILCKRKENIQKILLKLCEHLEEAHAFHKRRSCLAMYRVFVLLLLQDLPQGLAGTWAFAVRDIVYTLIRIISTQKSKNVLKIDGVVRDGEINVVLDDDLFTASCELLYQVAKVALSCCHQEIGQHLPAIVNEIIPFVAKKDSRAKKAVALLKFLVVENKSSLQSYISLLDPFPNQPEFNVFNEAYWSVRKHKDTSKLAEEIEHYLMISNKCPHTSRLEGIRHLCSRFVHHKKELLEVTKIDGNDSTVSELLMKLLRRLIKLCKNSSSEVKIEVGKLFAEVGLPVLYVSSFNTTFSEEEENTSYSKACQIFSGDEERCRNCRLLHQLNDCLIDRCIKKVAAAACCLKEVLQKPAIITLMKQYEEMKIDHLFGYLEPFKPPKRVKKSKESGVCSRSPNLENVLRHPDIWNPGNFTCHEEWISSLTSAIILSGGIKDEVLQCLEPLCKVHSPFADSIFSYLIHDLLVSHGDVYRELLSEQIKKIFSSHILSCSNQSRTSTPLITPNDNLTSHSANHDSIHSVLTVVNYLRKQPRLRSSTRWESNFWLDLDFLELAEAALKSSAYCTAILYVEIWSDIQRLSSRSTTASTGDIPMELSSESADDNQDTNYQSILFEAYAAIGEPDAAVYGSPTGLSTDLKARIHTYEQEKCWGKALRAYDLYCRQSDNQPCVGTVQSLKIFGLEHVTYNYLKGLGDDNNEEFLELQFESAWRNRIWDMDKNISDKSSLNTKGFNQCIYENIQSLQNNDLKLFHSSVNNCRLEIVKDLCRTNTESIWEVYPHISRLQCLVEMEQAKKLSEGCSNPENLLNSWIMNLPDTFHELEFLEPIMSLRTVLLQELFTLSLNDQVCGQMKTSLLQTLVKHSEMVSRLARHAGRYQISEKAMTTLKNLPKTDDVGLMEDYSCKIEEAKVFWFHGEQEIAMRLLRQINHSIQSNSSLSKLLYAQTLGLYGSWLAETRSENPNTIMEKYLDKAVELVESCSDKQESSIEAFLSLARFADSQYKNIQEYMKSWAFENKQSIMKKLKSEVANLKEHGVDKGRYLRDLSVQSESDEQELTQMKEDRLKYLQKAVRNYIRCLQVGEKYDVKVFRICSMWLENSCNDRVNDIVEHGIFSEKGDLLLIESRKFLPLMYQLAARLGARSHQNESFQRILTKLISQAAIDHPHHVIWIILALCNADKDNQYLNRGKKSSRLSKSSNKSQENSYVDKERVEAACAVIEKVRLTKNEVVSSMEILSEAYIQLAYYDVSSYKNQTGPLSMPDVALKKISNLRNVAVPTCDIKVDPTCCYKDIVSVERFDSKFHLCGGINLPKILICFGSDGVKRRQLIKGKDDLRQDAVMQQVFGMVNTLLLRNVETRKRNLKIRTYKVVPLSQRSGLVEWCEGTKPLGSYLIGDRDGAHQRYHPKDWSSIDCRKKLQVINRTNANQRYKVFKDVMSHFHPVFRHFFLEQFPDPSVWFEKRLGYTRSVATASIVGYIVGLGDRHVQNILIDCNTAELIHIDLGVAFEQGKMLPTPETVPFRLTRDLVDGMGISGVEGVFRRCCEKTMEVMRTSQEALLTIVEVLLYDPLYVWTLSPLKALSLQRKTDMDISEVPPANTDVLETSNEGETRTNIDETAVSKMAERVLVRLRQKLDGVEDGTLLSVKGQVNHLIREARDPKNLCRLFPGWQPWI